MDRVRNSGRDLPVLLAKGSTVDCMHAIEGLFAASRFDGGTKLLRAVELLDGAGFSIEF
jgi:hypothetical protein